MTLRGVCDLAHTLLVEDTERRVLAERHVAAVMLAAGAEGVELPDVASAVDVLNAELEAAPAPVSAPLQLLKRLGVA